MKKGMPIVRDVTVRPPKKEQEGVERQKSNPLAGLMTVTGFDKNDVLFRSNAAKVLQWRDGDGDLIAMLIRINSKLWGLCMNGDDDWEQMVRLYAHDDKDLLKEK